MPTLLNKVVESAETPAKSEDYIKVNGLRLVKPYYFDFLCSVKKRWLGKTIIDVFSEEFASRPRSYYQEAFEDGRLRIEGGKGTATADTLLNGNHRMRHFIHRHEPPVLNLPLEVVAETQDLIAVHKPASMPVHACGQYRKNTVMALLQMGRPDLGKLFPVHRLDKPVSGLLLIAKTAAAAKAVGTQITEPGAVHKTYIARVLGSFPDDPIAVDRQLAWDSGSNHAFLMEAEGSLSQKQSMGRVPEVGQNQELQAKEAQTGFRLLSVASDACTSLVECQPKTGRTHQIRVHLSFLGHPIANDSQYGGTYKGPDQVRTYITAARNDTSSHSGPSTSANATAAASQAIRSKTTQQDIDSADQHQTVNKRQKCTLEAALISHHARGASISTNCDQGNGGHETEVKDSNTCMAENQNPVASNYADLLVPDDLQDDMCMNCPRLIPPGYPTDMHPLWLHAQSYTSATWSFVCSKPEWANAEWTPPLSSCGHH
ncbi:MAG: RNA pseudourine synthase 7-like [Trebouxia sp. A1-2]|nr:MAG: RNA pseudourine synthase 7-like [Trebouxia sp. A1-2]